ncbi:metallophosphoesterase family protein [Pleomorphomonas koreensis]|uniref:metallophosphoesterase family protein n=1 Tax=Pleomorphomonas koreensis TaxID=257440 RepID=UPI00047B6D5C|nr:metallophosphoesterase family protein [Pleomorphomonas koreensis]
MRFLLVSDIHDNVTAVHQLRNLEQNRFDAIVVAGDIGSKTAAETLGLLATFACPVLYVYGNWDYRLGYDENFGVGCHHLHLASFACGPLSFIGFSGCPTHWGRNPIGECLYKQVDDRHAEIVKSKADAEEAFKVAKAEIETEFASLLEELRGGRKRPLARAKTEALEQKRDARVHKLRASVDKIEQSEPYQDFVNERWAVRATILAENRRALAEMIQQSAAPASQTIVVTHERMPAIADEFKGVPLFLFGHRHVFADTMFKGVRFINMAALDIRLLVESKGNELQGWDRFRNVNVGNYGVMEWSEFGGFEIERKMLDRYPFEQDWAVVQHMSMPGAPFLI